MSRITTKFELLQVYQATADQWAKISKVMAMVQLVGHPPREHEMLAIRDEGSDNFPVVSATKTLSMPSYCEIA